MAKFKMVISSSNGRSQVVEVEGSRAQPLIGKKIGEIVNGSIANLSNSKLQITGGSDKDGFPMKPNVHGGVRKSILLSGGVGFKASRAGERRRKMVRGNVITDEIVQINFKVLKS